MNDKIFQRIQYFFGLIPLGALFGVLFFMAGVEIKDLDIWLHLAMGKYITLFHFVPSFDVLSCSIAGKVWVNHEWLFQVFVYNIFSRFGADGLILMQQLLVTGTMFLLLLTGYNKRKQFLTTFFLFLVFLIYYCRFTTRPDLFSLFFFALYIFILALHLDKKWALPVLFAVQVLWVNIHGFFFFGPLLVLIGLFSEWLKRRVCLPYAWNASGRLTDEEFTRLKFVFLFSLLACLLNPYFIEGALYPFRVLLSFSGENKIFFEHIQELQKPLADSGLLSVDQWRFYKLAIFLSFMSFIFNRKNIDISAAFIWGVFLLFSLKAVRNLPFFAFASYLVFITNIQHVDFSDILPFKFSAPRFKSITVICLHLALLLWIFEFGATMSQSRYYDFDVYEYKSDFGGVSKQGVPYKALDFLTENHIRGNFFNDFNSGSYILGRAYPDIRVFIDGRTEVYGGRFFKMYQRILKEGDTALFEKVAENLRLTGVLLSSMRQRLPGQLFRHLYDSEDWRLVYFDYDAVVFLKNVPVNRRWIDRFSIDLSQSQIEPVDLYRLGKVFVRPTPYYFRAYSLETLDLDARAMEECREALKIVPQYAPVHALMGKMFTKQKDYKIAFEHFRIAAALQPKDKNVQKNYAQALMDSGRPDSAVKAYEKVIRAWPKDVASYFFLTKAYALSGQYNKAVEMAKTLYESHPKASADFLEIADVCEQQGAQKEAEIIRGLAGGDGEGK